MASFLNSDDLDVATVSETLLSHLERVPPPPLRFVTLGRFEVWQNARQVDKRTLGQRRAGELLRLLLISPGRTLARDAVIEALWPEKSPEAMQTPFHQATSALRHALEPDLPDKFPSRYLEVEGGQVTLHLPPGSWVDWEVFEQNVREEQVGRGARALWRRVVPRRPVRRLGCRAPRVAVSVLSARRVGRGTPAARGRAGRGRP